ncbi:asialoglycoprotein receptor 2-like isoform X2 [Hyperolius riggenbachi]|uniref:asialoglycoprotein receptor 2-like isoform X2 n=1 Tax=Hyperolius riggenbachi TaxID=752182 RepID=UPI0035A3013E
MKAKDQNRMPTQDDEEDNTYVNLEELSVIKKKKEPKAEVTSAGGKVGNRLVLILLALLCLMFIILVVFTSLLYIYSRNVKEEVADAKAHDKVAAKEQSLLKNEVKDLLTQLEKYKEEAGSHYSDIQKKLGALEKAAEDLRKVKRSACLTCEAGWKQKGESCYQLTLQNRAWVDAKKDCESKKAHLVVINDLEEMKFLAEFSEKKKVWIGLTDADGSWKWVDGTPYANTPKFWNPNQPDNWTDPRYGGVEDCVVTIHEDRWNDEHCSVTYPYACEKPASGA